jgi:hypothetical protein
VVYQYCRPATVIFLAPIILIIIIIIIIIITKIFLILYWPLRCRMYYVVLKMPCNYWGLLLHITKSYYSDISSHPLTSLYEVKKKELCEGYVSLRHSIRAYVIGTDFIKLLLLIYVNP